MKMKLVYSSYTGYIRGGGCPAPPSQEVQSPRWLRAETCRAPRGPSHQCLLPHLGRVPLQRRVSSLGTRDVPEWPARQPHCTQPTAASLQMPHLVSLAGHAQCLQCNGCHSGTLEAPVSLGAAQGSIPQLGPSEWALSSPPFSPLLPTPAVRLRPADLSPMQSCLCSFSSLGPK